MQSERKAKYPECATAIRYCPQGEVAYVDFGYPEKTFYGSGELWGRQVPVSEILKPKSLTVKCSKRGLIKCLIT